MMRNALSARQTEIAGLVALGKSSREIATTLFLSRRTVENHIAAIFKKLAVGSRTELISALWTPSSGESPSFEAARTRANNTNLPVQRTRLVGREIESAQIAQLFESGRLVTVTGAGGIGKTRAALAVGELLLAQMRAGVWFVELAPLGKSSAAAAAIAQALGVRESPRQPLLETLLAHVKQQRMLLILDNCEHVIGDVASIADALLRGCPQLRILATSRELLRIADEQTYRLPSLSVPGVAAVRDLSVADALGYAAVSLFVERAEARDRQFALSRENAGIVAEICRRLDGIPLAIELAAARVNSLSLAVLAARLDQRFSILTSGHRAALPRQQTMRALIDWSYELLAPVEQHAFERLSIFAGGCDLASASAIYAHETDELGVFALLSSLVDKSLVIADTANHVPRYRLLESTRQYAREKLVARGEATLMAHRHARTYCDFAEWLEQTDGRGSDIERARADLELENWRAALVWSLEERGDVVLGQRLTAALVDTWIDVSLVEGRRWIEACVVLIDQHTPSAVKVRLETAAIGIAASFGDWENVVAASAHQISVCRESGATLEAARLEYWAGNSLVRLGRSLAGEPLLRAALSTARSLQNRQLIGVVLQNLAYARSTAGDRAEARACISEALGIWHAIGADGRALSATAVLAETEFRAGDIERARELATTSVERLRELGDVRRLMVALINLAAYLIACDRFDEARAAAREALGLPNEVQRHAYQTCAIQHLAAVAALSGNAGATGPTSEIAAQLLGYVDARIDALGSPREFTEQQEYDRVCGTLRSAYGGAEFGRLLALGATMTHERAISDALSIDENAISRQPPSRSFV